MFQQLKLAIVRGEVQPGDRLTEEAVAAAYRVSRTPVRESFRRLEQEGLLAHLSYGGYTVRPVDFDEMQELYEVRVALEELSVARACAGADPELLARLHGFWSAPPPAGAPADLNIVYADEDFHETIALAGGSRTLHRLLRGINERLHSLRTRDFAAVQRIALTFHQHFSILQAIAHSDCRLAGALVRAHILESQVYVEQAARTALGVPE